jgi:NADH-quinone oxidoreductase subunit I
MFGKGLLSGMGITFKRMFSRPNTVLYPEEKIPLGPLFRGGTIDLDLKKCIACGLCALSCPNKAIDLATEKNESGKKELTRYVHQIAVCLYCNYCIEACPTKAIVWTRNYEMSCLRREDLEIDCMQSTTQRTNEGGPA